MRLHGFLFRIGLLSLVCATLPLSASDVAISDVNTRYKTTGDFKSISEFFTGKESKPDVLERTVPDIRDGMYFFVDLDWLKKGDLLLGTQIEIDYIRSDDAQPRKAVFYLYETRSTLPEMQFGLTGPDWPGKSVRVLAWKVTIRDPLGVILAEKTSFLWGFPDKQREVLIADGRAEELPNGKQNPKSDLKRPEPPPAPAVVPVVVAPPSGKPDEAQKPKVTLSPERMAAIKASADRGEARGLTAMGVIYLQGIGVEPNAAKALEYFRKAAALNNPSANYDLGLMYARGDGTAPNPEQAEFYFLKAAEAGNVKAQYNLGYYYSYSGQSTGNGTRAAQWYERAALQGYAPAQYNLAFMLARGDAGVKMDAQHAYYWALLAEQGKYPNAEKLVKKLESMLDKDQQRSVENAVKTFKPVPEKQAAKPAQKEGITNAEASAPAEKSAPAAQPAPPAATGASAK